MNLQRALALSAALVAAALFERDCRRACEREGGGHDSEPQVEIGLVAGLGVAVGIHKDDLDGMGSADIFKGVGLHRTNALAVDLDVGDGIALIRGNGECLISALADVDIAGGGDRATSSGSCRDGVVAVAAAATAVSVGPVGVDGGICREYGIRCDLCSAALFGVPAVEAVTAAS